MKVEEVVSGSPTTITEQAFNGLHWRTVLKQDTTQVRDGLDQVRRQYYDASWRLVFESIDDGWSSGFTEDRVVEQFWGLRYIDDAVLRRVKSTGGSEGDYTRHHYLTDVQFSVVAVMASNGGVVERVRYTPYGEARHFWGDDVNGDRQTDFFDFLDLQDQVGEPEPYIGGDDYVVEMDLDRDGDIDIDDWNLIGSAKSALPSGWISDAGSTGLDNTVGYDGYLFLPASEQYHVRFRCYDPELGRWLETDPLGVQPWLGSRRLLMGQSYTDGMSLYSYVKANPARYIDSGGLQSQDLGGPKAPAFQTLGCEDNGPAWPCQKKCHDTMSGLYAVICSDKCSKAAKKFREWYADEMDLSWTRGLPDCPCSIGDCNPDPETWKDPTKELHGYHVGATRCMRSKTVTWYSYKKINRRANQCCYDGDGKLITHGSGSGSADRSPVTYYTDLPGHKKRDMDPADLAKRLDGGEWGCYSEAYLRVRPQIGSDKCPKNP